jgi:hypothetical protein
VNSGGVLTVLAATPPHDGLPSATASPLAGLLPRAGWG